ncbi:MAG: hypothetical protein CMB37_05290 [Euryarchaeota archaeon]|nr:hypothetical protein [Euryarchaeota archaeon]MEC7704003.1 hypothetical protein [Candidatus Thermoplasmatota archaeon]MED5486946.1 hypothetical protein [Candidatus Thermoplasmatota archaeon]
MQSEIISSLEVTSFAELEPTRRPRGPKDGVLVHDSGSEKNGRWRPLYSKNAWIHLHQRSLEAIA